MISQTCITIRLLSAIVEAIMRVAYNILLLEVNMRKTKLAGLILAFAMLFTACTPAADPTTSAGTQPATTAGHTTGSTTTASDTAAQGTTPDTTTADPVKVEGGTYVYPLTADPKVMNPLYAVDSDTLTPVNAMFAPLFMLDAAKGETRYYLAESVETSLLRRGSGSFHFHSQCGTSWFRSLQIQGVCFGTASGA